MLSKLYSITTTENGHKETRHFAIFQNGSISQVVEHLRIYPNMKVTGTYYLGYIDTTYVFEDMQDNGHTWAGCEHDDFEILVKDYIRITATTKQHEIVIGYTNNLTGVYDCIEYFQKSANGLSVSRLTGDITFYIDTLDKETKEVLFNGDTVAQIGFITYSSYMTKKSTVKDVVYMADFITAKGEGANKGYLFTTEKFEYIVSLVSVGLDSIHNVINEQKTNGANIEGAKKAISTKAANIESFLNLVYSRYIADKRAKGELNYCLVSVLHSAFQQLEMLKEQIKDNFTKFYKVNVLNNQS